MRVARHFIDIFILLEIWDCPGNVTVDTLGLSLANVSTMVFVIHIRGLYQHPVSKLYLYTKRKGFKRTTTSDTSVRYMNASWTASDESPEFESIYDHSIREAFSRVLYKLIDPLSSLLLSSPKAFLFDTFSKIHVATDACRLSPTLAPTPSPIATTSTPTSGTTLTGTRTASALGLIDKRDVISLRNPEANKRSTVCWLEVQTFTRYGP
ncbi:uncharacterized protein HD556DRAFT_1493058 [Suillus plorans]|uniref:GTP-binding protein n=1 Tax=Suillus plorans TaxID=116603 RepID=A0A9P7AHF1_9AGAM|nr:uncharacterized protein HD556DRAFT_1493058 [Suillus plorans]KAG1789535.1 hypothetical protein HD556DRAFT_1493058 [Suillus plorans]